MVQKDDHTEEVENFGGEVDNVDDNGITFSQEYSKEEAKYRIPDDDEYDEDHSKCGGCSFYIDGGGCALVRGEIDPDDHYCEELYSDVAVGGHAHDGETPVEVALVGYSGWSDEEINEFFLSLDSYLFDELGTLNKDDINIIIRDEDAS
jgi:hypothetical protein